MANLLQRTIASPPVPPFDPDQRARFESRFATLVETLAQPACDREVDRLLFALEPELEELENAPSLVAALDLLDAIERARHAALDHAGDASGPDRTVPRSRPGDLILHWLGRSLATGEAGIASRGFFDGFDRPPLRYWLEAIGRRREGSLDEFEVVIVAWVPTEDLERARTGCEASASRSLAFLEQASPDLANQLRPLLLRPTIRGGVAE